ncbi:putative endo alpha-1,4 polygalactosaminidase [hydrothermal vent metagenome]|uniref:Putative endo alpha-1,4 polygalactosaminidase n=1 Tax=hydrothermal vent metagenome TaxID=652676 RepID=A0A3B0T8B1_9ZZZZ
MRTIVNPLKYALLAAFFAMPTLAAPLPGASWDWQLSEAIAPPADIKVFDADPDNVTRDQIMELNKAGVYTICYVSVGTLENWRSDVNTFYDGNVFYYPVVGKAYGNWPGEFFLDIRQPNLRYVMQRRFMDCALKGFQAVEADNMDVYTNDSGFEISRQDTMRYIEQLASDAHALGLEIGQKNVPELTGELVAIMDFVITESCFADGWCGDVLPYIEAGKPVFNAEYTDTGPDFAAACAYGTKNKISMILKDRDLTSELETCP